MHVRLYTDFNTMTMDLKERRSINPHPQPVLTQDLHPYLVMTLYDEEADYGS